MKLLWEWEAEMRKWIFAAAGAALLAGLVACATAPTIKTGWDRQVNFGTFHTWTWQPDGSIPDAVCGGAGPAA